MACKYKYKGKTYEADEFMDVLLVMTPSEASKYMPAVGNIPDAPFVGKTNSWALLAMKRMIRYAVDNNFDKIAWTTGSIQAERYDLSKQIDSVKASRVRDSGIYSIGIEKDGNFIEEKRLNESELEEFLGKDLAKKIIESEDVQKGFVTNFSGVDLKVGGEGMKAFYDSILPNMVNKYVKKWGGKVGETKIGVSKKLFFGDDFDNLEESKRLETEKRGETVHSLPITDKIRDAALSGQALFQQTEELTRGNIQFSEETVINLFKNSDLSTFLHESGHLFLEMERRFAGKFGESENQKALLEWLGAESLEHVNEKEVIDGTEQFTAEAVYFHEKFARGFESYLREGKAPSLKLRDAFAAFARWLKRIYQKISMLDVEITPQIREVMDRMLATEEEIELARNNPAYDQFFKSQEQAGMSDKEWEAYQKRIEKAKTRSEETLDAKLLKELHRRKSKEWKDEKAPMVAEEKERLGKEPVYEILSNIRVEPLNHEQVLDILGVKKIPGKLIGKTKKGGTDLNFYAESYGYVSAGQMMKAIVAAPKLSDAASAAAEARMIEKYGDILNDGSIEAEAREAVHNEEQAKLLLEQLRIVARKNKTKPINREQLKARAKDMIGAMRHGDIKPDKYYRNEIRAAENAQNAKTDAERVEAKTQQLVNHYLYKEAIEAKENIERHRKYIDGVKRRDYPVTQVDKSYIQNMKLLARMYDMRKSPEKLKDLDDFLNWFISQTQVENEYIKLEMMDENLVIAMEAKQRGKLAEYDFPSYKDLTSEELRSLYEMLRHLRYVGGQMADLAKTEFLGERDSAIISIEENGGRDVKAPDEPQKSDGWANAGKEFLYGNIHLRNLTRKLDGMKEDGWFYRNVYQLAISSANNFMDLQRTVAEQYRKEFDDLNNLVIGKNKKITRAKEDGGEWTLSSEGRVMLALYWGTQSSREAIMAGHGVTEADVEGMMGFMTNDELTLVNKIWKLNESLKPEIMSLAYRMYGASPVMLDPTSFTVNGIKMTGGHMRLFYGGSTAELDVNEEKAYAGSPLSYSKPGTMHERVGAGGKRVLLDKSNIIRSLNENLHAITYAENFKKIARFVNNRELKEAIIRKHGEAFYKNFVAKVQSDMGFKRDVEVEQWWGMIARQIRQAATFKHLGFSIRNTVQQFSAVPIAGQEVGRSKLIYQYGKFASNPKKNIKIIHELSAFMRNRFKTVNREAAEQLSHISEGTMLDDIKGFSFIMQTTVDSMNSYPTWMTKYEDVMERLSKQALNEEDMQAAHKKAVIDADLAVKESIGSGMDIDLGRLFSTKRAETTRMMTMFGSWFNAYTNRIYRDYQRQRNRKSLKNEVEFERYNFTSELLQTAISTPIIVGILNALLIWNFPDYDDDENWMLWAMDQYGSFMWSLLPYIREIPSAWKGFSQKTPVGIGAQSLTDTTKAEMKLISGDITFSKALIDTAKGVTTFIALPGSGQVFRMIDYWDSYEQGNEREFDPFQMILHGKTRK